MEKVARQRIFAFVGMVTFGSFPGCQALFDQTLPDEAGDEAIRPIPPPQREPSDAATNDSGSARAADDGLNEPYERVIPGALGSLAATTAASAPTICSYNFSWVATGWRSHDWRPEDCSNGLPKPGAVGVGQSITGAGAAGQVHCTPTTGSHYNPYQTSGMVKCFYPDPQDTEITVCSTTFSYIYTGWQTHAWYPFDCTRGLPEQDWVAFGMGQNGSGTSGQVSCMPTYGGHYNHPTVHGQTAGYVACAYVKPTHQRVRSCNANFAYLADGWRTNYWAPGNCPQGMPTYDFAPIGWPTNSNGTVGEANCTLTFGSHYSHPTYGQTHANARCLFAQRDPEATLTTP